MSFNKSKEKWIPSVVFFLAFSAVGSGSMLYAQSDHAQMQLRVDPVYFSPNQDDLQDQLFFYPVFQSNNIEVTKWVLDIESVKKTKRIEKLAGTKLPALLKWDGLDKNLTPVSDGAYLAKLKVANKTGTFYAEQIFFVDTVPPEVSIDISTPVFDQSFLENGQLTISPHAFDANPIDRWLLQVVNTNGHTAYVFWSSGSVRDVQWAGTDQATRVLVAQGDYRLVFQAWDKAGNESRPAFVDLKVNVTPRQMLERAIHRIKVNETTMGLIVQLGAQTLFQNQTGPVGFSDLGDEYLREAAILANAYPETPIKIDAYSRVKKGAAQDRDQASVYGWKVYSYFIKNGFVKPSRMTVRGRGRSAMFDRRAVGVPVIKNGVEIILEGQGPW